ncbi:uncharacterized protein N7515_001654 [Penicillium bovifimosum]|uniref:Retrotransposon gag domain-containing protein n=1 Tax=Penicillium bovifimosum TaxID=126998 RepID=A0A9W9HA37_9EURO|nr:uncharacterized protein N7515_001654 [Penicillium bovifimosum]KAJ5142867.1 hypothetical protein N7515_001654 [Penicillium bovifimosum]
MAQALPAPGPTPSFDGKDATKFLQGMQDMCIRHGIQSTETMMMFLPQYCSDTTRAWVERRPSWNSRNWSEFKVEFLAYWYDGDSRQLRHTTRYLESLVRVHRTTEEDYREYLTEFDNISAELFDRGELTDYGRADLLIRGLPEKWIVSALDLSGRRRITYSEAYSQVNRYIREQNLSRWYSSNPDPLDVRNGTQPENRQVHQQGQQTKPLQQFQSRQQDPSGEIDRIQEIQSQIAALAIKVLGHQDPRVDPRYGPTSRG